MTLALDFEALDDAGRAAELLAARLRRTGLRMAFGPTEIDDAADLARLHRRVHRLASRLGSNGRSLQALVHDARAVDGQVSLTFLVLSGTGWR